MAFLSHSAQRTETKMAFGDMVCWYSYHYNPSYSDLHIAQPWRLAILTKLVTLSPTISRSFYIYTPPWSEGERKLRRGKKQGTRNRKEKKVEKAGMLHAMDMKTKLGVLEAKSWLPSHANIGAWPHTFLWCIALPSALWGLLQFLCLMMISFSLGLPWKH